MKVKVLNTLKSGSHIIPAGQILTDDEIPAFIVKLAEAESEHIAVLEAEVLPRELGPNEVLKDASKEAGIEGVPITAEEVKESVEDGSEEASTEEKTPKKRK